jgi:hypothetical protein
MDSFALIYRGPSVSEDPRKASVIAGAIAARWPLSEKEALRRLAKTPFAFISGLSHSLAVLFRDYLTGFGADVEVISSKVEKQVPALKSVAKPAGTARRWYFRGAWRAGLAAMSSGLLLSTFIIAAGMILALFSGRIRLWGIRQEILGAIGWITVALGILVLFAAFALRFKTLVGIVISPDRSTPLQALRSYFSAVNDHNWEKALSCLAARPDSTDLGALPRDESAAYFRSLAAEMVLPGYIDPASLTILYEEGPVVIMSFRIDVITKEAAGGGARLRRSYLESRRFQRVGEEWFLVDGYLMGQRNPSRLPVPGCLECGVESEVKRDHCPGCGSSFSPSFLALEEWLPPTRKPELAALLSAFIPGLGQAYNGQLLKGMLVAATCWMILPWAAGVLDALLVAERINRNASYHDLPSRPILPVFLHATLFVTAVALVFIFIPNPPFGKNLFNIDASRQAEEDLWEEKEYRDPGGRFALTVPRGWSVKPIRGDEGRLLAIVSQEGVASVVIKSKPLVEDWQAGVEVHKVRRELEEMGHAIANFKIIVSGGHWGFEVNSYSEGGEKRHSIVCIATENGVLEAALTCPSDAQADLLGDFEYMINSLEFPTETRVDSENNIGQ